MINLRRIAGFSLLSAIWGTSWVAFSELEGHCPPFRAAAIRYGVAAFLVLIAAVVLRRPVPRGKALRAMLVLGVTMVALPFALLLWGGRVVPVGTVAVLFALAPIALALTSSAGSGVEAPRRSFYATLGGFGAMVVAMSGALSFPLAHPAALAATAFAVVSVTASFAFAKRELQESSSLFTAGIQLAAAAVVLAAVSAVTEPGQASRWTSASLISLGLLSVAGSAVAVPLFYWLLRECEPSQVATLEWMQPLISVAEGAVLLHQRVPGTFYLGSLVVIVCVAAIFTIPREHQQSLSLNASSGQNGA